MVKAQSFLFAFLFLIQSVQIQISDLLHFSDLVEHYNYHSEEFGDDLFSFIEKHYGTLAQKHSDDEPQERQDHQNLPFHKVISQMDIQLQLNSTLFSIEYQEESSFRKQFHFYRFGAGIEFFFKVFQPPRI
ncbi:MAG: hypothetical protein WBN16_08170 [Lutimonas sp.]